MSVNKSDAAMSGMVKGHSRFGNSDTRERKFDEHCVPGIATVG